MSDVLTPTVPHAVSNQKPQLREPLPPAMSHQCPVLRMLQGVLTKGETHVGGIPPVMAKYILQGKFGAERQ